MPGRERFVLPLSAMTRWSMARARCCGKMPGDHWQQVRQPARLSRLHVDPSRQEAALHGRRDRPAGANGTTTPRCAWPLLDDPRHRGMQRLVHDLNAAYRGCRRCTGRTPRPRASAGSIGDDSAQSVFAYLRFGAAGDPPALVVVNLTPVPRHAYRIGVPQAGCWHEVLNSDAARLWRQQQRQRRGDRRPRRCRATASATASRSYLPPLADADPLAARTSMAPVPTRLLPGRP